jgi:HK97 family phage prohead protease
VIKRSAFNRSIAQKDDIRLLTNHEGVPMARTKSGTLTVGVDESGLWFDAPSLDPANPDVQRLVSAIGRGDMDQCSFAGYFTDAPVLDGLREVREVQLVDVSNVTFPWYDDTSVGLTGDRAVDRLLVSARSVDGAPLVLTEEQRANALRSLRAAPPGKTSYGDLHMALWDAIEAMLQAETGTSEAWCYVDDWGTDWAVYRVFSYDTYDYGPYMQITWKQNADGTFKLGAPFPVDKITEYRPVTVADEAKSYTVAEARALLGV